MLLSKRRGGRGRAESIGGDDSEAEGEVHPDEDVEMAGPNEVLFQLPLVTTSLF